MAKTNIISGTGIDIQGLDEFMEKLEYQAKKGFRKELESWVLEMGVEFLDLVTDNIIKAGNVSTSALLKSFSKGDSNNIWKLSRGNLVLEIGSTLEYADFVNSGHWTVNENTRGAYRLSDGTLARFVPGKWIGDKFQYDPSADGGMVLKRKWVEGSYFWDDAVIVFESMFEQKLEKKLIEWTKKF